jgi:hypothetical protein
LKRDIGVGPPFRHNGVNNGLLRVSAADERILHRLRHSQW